MTTFGFPSVKVPVLSKAIILIAVKSERKQPPLNKTPCRAKFEMPANVAGMTDTAKAQGEADTKKSN